MKYFDKTLRSIRDNDNDNDVRCYDPMLFREYLEKVTSFYTRFDLPKLKTFVENGFNQDFWKSLELTEKDLSAYIKYYKKAIE